MADGQVPSFKVDTAFDGAKTVLYQFEAIEVWTTFHKAPRARITILESDGFPAANSGDFAITAPITISFGYGGDLNMVFTGIVAFKRIEIDPAQGSRLVVQAYGGEAPRFGGLKSLPAPVLTLEAGNNIVALADETAKNDVLGAKPLTAGTVTYVGSTVAEAGNTISLSGLGMLFDATVLVLGVHHVFRDGRWLTTATFGAPPEPAS